MWRQQFAVAVAVAALTAWAAPAGGAEGTGATVRTYAGGSYALAALVVEVSYTIGELKDSKEQEKSDKFAPAIVLNTSASAGQTEQPKPEAQTAEQMFRARREVAELPLGQSGVEIRVPLAQMRLLSLSRTPVAGPSLPPYVSLYRFTASAVLVGGEQVNADYVNWGTAVFKGMSAAGPVSVPWGDVMSVTFDR
jgi:hypothetical protein